MAVGDIYRVQFHYQGLAQAASTGLYYRETSLSVANGLGNRSVVFSAITTLSQVLRGVLSSDWSLSSIQSSKVYDDPDPQHQDTVGVQAGLRTPPALPADNAVLLQLFQDTFGRTSDGRMYLPGLAIGNTVIGKLAQTFIDIQLSALVAVLSVPLPESGGTGEWEPGLISAKVRDAVPGSKNWVAAFAPVIGIQGWPVIARQVRRRTKVYGYS